MYMLVTLDSRSNHDLYINAVHTYIIATYVTKCTGDAVCK